MGWWMMSETKTPTHPACTNSHLGGGDLRGEMFGGPPCFIGRNPMFQFKALVIKLSPMEEISLLSDDDVHCSQIMVTIIIVWEKINK